MSTTQRIRDLHYFYDILTSDTPGAERAWDAMDKMNLPNPLALTSYLLENKDFFLRYCDDEGSRIRTAKTALLMYAGSMDGRSKAKDDQLADITDKKYKIYNFEWNNASKNWSANGAIEALKDLPLEDKVDIIEDIISVFEAGGDITEKQQESINYLKESFGIEGNKADEKEKMLPSTSKKAEPTAMAATINSVKANHNTVLDEIDGEPGVLLHVNFDIVNYKGTECVCGAWLFYADGTAVKATASDGQVASYGTFIPQYDKTHFDDFQLFIPYSEFKIRNKDEYFYLIIQAQTLSGVRISSRYREDIHYHDDFQDIQFDDYDGKELRVTARLADSPSLNRSGEIRVFFYSETGQRLVADILADKNYIIDGGSVSVNRRFVSGSAKLLKDGITLSIPYAAMNLTAKKLNQLSFRVGIRFEEENDWSYSDFVYFTVNVNKSLFSKTYSLVK